MASRAPGPSTAALAAALVATWLGLAPWAIAAAALAAALALAVCSRFGRERSASAAELLVRAEAWGRSEPPEPLMAVREQDADPAARNARARAS